MTILRHIVTKFDSFSCYGLQDIGVHRDIRRWIYLFGNLWLASINIVICLDTALKRLSNIAYCFLFLSHTARKSNHKSYTNTTQKAIRLFQRHCVLSRFGKGDTNFTVENNSGCIEDNATGTDDACVAASAATAAASVLQLQSTRISMTMRQRRQSTADTEANLGGKSWPAPYGRFVYGAGGAKVDEAGLGWPLSSLAESIC